GWTSFWQGPCHAPSTPQKNCVRTVRCRNHMSRRPYTITFAACSPHAERGTTSEAECPVRKRLGYKSYRIPEASPMVREHPCVGGKIRSPVLPPAAAAC